MSQSLSIDLYRIHCYYIKISDKVWMGHDVEPAKAKMSSKDTKSDAAI